jgi:hypothetical protein
MVTKSAEKSNEDPTAHLIASQIQEQWAVFSASFDQLAKENADMDPTIESSATWTLNP